RHTTIANTRSPRKKPPKTSLKPTSPNYSDKPTFNKAMEWILQRFSDNTDSTLGLMFKIIGYEGKPRLHFNSFVIEDEYREVKVKGETRIPAGRYELKIRKQDTPLTLKYRKRYPEWFQY